MNITFIGGGNMATALIGGLLQQGMPPAQLCVVEIDEASRTKIRAVWGVKAVATLAEIAAGGEADSGAVVLAVKPQHLAQVAAELAPLLKNQLVVSIAAGIRAPDISRWLGNYARVVRAMPNTPALIRAGITGLYALPGVSAEEKKNAEMILGAVGQVLWLEQEDMLDAVTAVSGSGPAYVFYFIEAMQQAALELGFSDAQARQLSLQTFLGAAQLAAQSAEPAAQLRANVTSKGGTTERALNEMETAQIKPHFVAAIRAAQARAQQMGDELGKT